MKPFLLLLTATAGLALLDASPVVALGGSAAAQRVEITYTGVLTVGSRGTIGSRGTFRLRAGNASDTGGAVDSITEELTGRRSGQAFIDVKFKLALKGRRGTLEIRWSGRYVSAGKPWEVVTGTWSIAKGTGEYAGARGTGRIAGVFTAQDNRYFQHFQGFVTLGSWS
jgi:hypothetical protein